MFGLTPYSRRDGDLSFFNPFRELEDMERNFFSLGASSHFRTDIRDTGKEFVLETDLPGFDRENISLDIKDGCLTVSASRTEKKEEKSESTYLRRERSFGSYARSFDLTGIDEEKISATFKDGVLEVVLPKKEEKDEISRKIDIH